MSDNIVTRLRLRPTILRKNQLGDMETDRAATALFDDCHAIMREAADEIERLRRNTGCARDQRSTQFCAEALDAQREVARLTAERDEARRSCCEYAAIVDGADTADGMESGRFYEIAMKYMKDRGWDCFKEDKP